MKNIKNNLFLISLLFLCFGIANHLQAQTNIALNKTAKQSSQTSASRAVDGNTDGMWDKNSVTHTNDNEKNSWWEVDLGGMYAISEIKIWNRTDCCWERLQNFYIMVSERPIQENNKVSFQFAQGPLSFTSETEKFKTWKNNVEGRYVRIFIEGTGILSLAEVEVFGQPIKNTNVAWGKAVTQSSTGQPNAEATKAIDGNTNSWWQTDKNNTICQMATT